MKKIHFFLFAAVAAMLVACGGGGNVSPNGYKFTKHTNADGKPANVGDYAFVHICVFQDDSLVNSTYQMGQTVPLLVPNFDSIPPDQRGVGKANPVSDVLSVMKVGDSVTVQVPIDTMMRKNPNLQNVKKLMYSIRLTDVKTKAEYDQFIVDQRKEVDDKMNVEKAREAAVASQLSGLIKDYNAGNLKGKLNTTPTGLKVLMLEEGTGKQAEAGKKVDVMYYGMLLNGKEFDNSFKRGQVFSFDLGQGRVIPGWDQGIAMLKEGAKAVLFIPSELAYGEQGAGDMIPPKSELAFYVELQKVN